MQNDSCSISQRRVDIFLCQINKSVFTVNGSSLIGTRKLCLVRNLQFPNMMALGLLQYFFLVLHTVESF